MRSAVVIKAIRTPTGALRGSHAPVCPANLAVLAQRTRCRVVGIKKPFFSLDSLRAEVGQREAALIEWPV